MDYTKLYKFNDMQDADYVREIHKTKTENIELVNSVIDEVKLKVINPIIEDINNSEIKFSIPTGKKFDLYDLYLINDNLELAKDIIEKKGFKVVINLEKSPDGKREMTVAW